METYETSATVGEDGRVQLTGVPLPVGTEVTVSIREKAILDSVAHEKTLEEARARLSKAFATIRGRNTEPIGPLRREELYDRKVLR